MPFFKDSPQRAEMSQALDHLQSALAIIDRIGSLDDAAPHIDLAICRLEASMGRDAGDNSAVRLQEEIDQSLAAVFAEKPSEGTRNVWG